MVRAVKKIHFFFSTIFRQIIFLGLAGGLFCTNPPTQKSTFQRCHRDKFGTHFEGRVCPSLSNHFHDPLALPARARRARSESLKATLPSRQASDRHALRNVAALRASPGSIKSSWPDLDGRALQVVRKVPRVRFTFSRFPAAWGVESSLARRENCLDLVPRSCQNFVTIAPRTRSAGRPKGSQRGALAASCWRRKSSEKKKKYFFFDRFFSAIF